MTDPSEVRTVWASCLEEVARVSPERSAVQLRTVPNLAKDSSYRVPLFDYLRVDLNAGVTHSPQKENAGF